MSVHTPNPVWSCGVIWLLISACGPAPAEPAASATTPAAPATTPGKPVEPVKVAPTKATPAKRAEVSEDVPLPLVKFLGQPVADVQALLGEHLGKGMMRETCVRFVPDRTFFACKYALQRYADKTGNFASIQVTYEDGAATGVAYDGWKHASGPFDPQALLKAIGLTLPDAGEESAPDANVRLWRWFNHKARLVIAGKQYRVEASVIDDDWARSRVEVSLNNPLTAEQQAKIVLPASAAK